MLLTVGRSFKYYCFLIEKDAKSKLSRDSQQVDSTTEQYLYIMIPSLLNNMIRALHYIKLPRKPDRPFRKHLGFLS